MAAGIFIAYQRTDECFAAMQLARVIERLGHEVSILSPVKPEAVDPHWDNRVLRITRCSYLDWRKELSHLFFFNVPPRSFLLNGTSSRKLPTFVVVQWDDLTDEQELETLKEVDQVICPSKACYKHLRRHRVVPQSKLTLIPWDIGIPFVRGDHEVDPQRVGVVWNLDGSQALVQNLSFMEVVDTLTREDHIYVTIFYNNYISSEGVASLKQLHQQAEGRVEMYKNMPLTRQLLSIAAHDLTLWPSLTEGFGLTGLASLSVGTPCLSYDYPVNGEIVQHQVNGELVPCDLDENWFGVPSVEDNNEVFLEHALTLSNDPDRLGELRQNTHVGLDTRRSTFEDQVSKLLDI